MKLDDVNSRVDSALQKNSRAETVVLFMSSGVFVLGAFVLLVSYWIKNPYIASITVLVDAFLYWPIREVIKIRRENLVLQVVPSIVMTLSPSDAAYEIKKTLAYLRGEKS
ncbi:MAG: hypothetical protein P4M13_10555 [Alphaproteobacteria bacterium]|nr:hypothetical protein [Alphaproteobacteria bacterium]